MLSCQVSRKHSSGLSPQSIRTVTTSSGEPVQIGDNHGIHCAGIHQGEKPRHAWPVQGFCGFARVNDDLSQFRAQHNGHGANLLRSRFKRNAEALLDQIHPRATATTADPVLGILNIRFRSAEIPARQAAPPAPGTVPLFRGGRFPCFFDTPFQISHLLPSLPGWG
jgi:hypothetical protein